MVGPAKAAFPFRSRIRRFVPMFTSYADIGLTAPEGGGMPVPSISLPPGVGAWVEGMESL